MTSKNARRARKYLAGYDRVEARMAEVEARDGLRNWQPPVSGEAIMAMLGAGEGVAVGMLKGWGRDAILDGDVPNEATAARAFVATRLDEARRRERLFIAVVPALRGDDRAAAGPVKDALFTHDLPADDDAALAHVLAVRDAALAARDAEA